MGIHADSARIRGFAGLPDGSHWIVDEVLVRDGDSARGDAIVVAGEELARRMLAAGAGDLLREAEMMVAR